MVAIDIHTTPALKPPYGVESDFDNGYSLKPHLVAASAVCLTMCVFSVVARIFTKVRLLKKVEIEDCEWFPNFTNVRTITKLR
jgi:hypothetical protein